MRLKLFIFIVLLFHLEAKTQTFKTASLGIMGDYSAMIATDKDGYLHFGSVGFYGNTYSKDFSGLASGAYSYFKKYSPATSKYFPSLRVRDHKVHYAVRCDADCGMGILYWSPTTGEYDCIFANEYHTHYPQLQVSSTGVKHFWLQADGMLPSGQETNIVYQNTSGGGVKTMVPNNYDLQGKGELYDYATVIDNNDNVHWLGGIRREAAGPGKKLYHNFSNNGNFLTTPNLINSEGFFPSMAVDADNNIHAVWQNGPIYYSKYNGVSWSAPRMVSDSGLLGARWAVYQQIASSSNPLLSLRKVKGFDSTSFTCGNWGIFRSDNNWENYDIQYVDGVGHKAIFPVDTTYAYVVGTGGRFWKTTSGGRVLTTAPYSDGWIEDLTNVTTDLNDCWFTDTISGYAIGNAGTIIKTIDGGDNWTTITSPSTVNLNAMAFTNDNSVGYIAGNSGKVFKTTDSGATWLECGNTYTTQALNDVFVLSADTVWITGNSKVIKVSYDGEYMV
jgi:photosystem II stability/assembly factor-like uncharacterized protein